MFSRKKNDMWCDNRYSPFKAPYPEIGEGKAETVNIAEKGFWLAREQLHQVCNWRNKPGVYIDLTCGTGNGVLAAAIAGWMTFGIDKSLTQHRAALVKLGRNDIARYLCGYLL